METITQGVTWEPKFLVKSAGTVLPAEFSLNSVGNSVGKPRLSVVIVYSHLIWGGRHNCHNKDERSSAYIEAHRDNTTWFSSLLQHCIQMPLH